MASEQTPPTDSLNAVNEPEKKSKRITKDSFKRASRVLKFFKPYWGRYIIRISFPGTYLRNCAGLPMAPKKHDRCRCA